MNITQMQVDALESWIENRKEAYLRKGFFLAANTGVEVLSDFASGEGLSDEDKGKSLSDIKAELDLAEDFHKEARQILFAGR
ncbi:MAG: hypothetical protein MI743_09230, partial [Sneathiellales bacterium]|nr:hypothetical protein [Sneathiellales bacterium]